MFQKWRNGLKNDKAPANPPGLLGLCSTSDEIASVASLLTAARRHSTAALSAALGPGTAAALGRGATTLSAASDLSATKLSATLDPGIATTLAALDFHTATASAFDLD